MDNQYTIRKATTKDTELILRMFDHSRNVMRADGNTEQWQGYPTCLDVADDIRRQVAHIIELTAPRTPLGTFALVPGIEPTYHHIDHGRWIDTRSPYCTLHRLAALPETHGIARAALRHSMSISPHLRVDTHASNRPMRHILLNAGFVLCGTIYMPDGSPRDAYEWWRWDKVPRDLKLYVEQVILPRHNAYDPAHRPDHVRRVIARAMNISRPAGETPASDPTMDLWILPKAEAMIYTAAAMHDIGICCGREEHHLHSGRIIREDRELRRWFSKDEIELIAQAAEDHRASASRPPRSPLGCIVAEADRDIEPLTILRRTVEYGLSHYPTLDRQGHWHRTLQHLHEKYAEGGYIKLWLADSPNTDPLADLRTLIRDEHRLRPLFDNLFDTLTNENPLKNQNS